MEMEADSKCGAKWCNCPQFIPNVWRTTLCRTCMHLKTEHAFKIEAKKEEHIYAASISNESFASSLPLPQTQQKNPTIVAYSDPQLENLVRTQYGRGLILFSVTLS